MNNKIEIVFDDGKEPILVDEPVLTLSSPCFKIMMESSMVEKQNHRIELKGKDRNEFVVLLSFLTPGTSRLPKITVDNADFLLALSNEYCIEHIKQECIDFIKKQPSTIDRVVQAHMYGFQDHLESCIKTLLRNGVKDWGPCTDNLELLQLMFKISLDVEAEKKPDVFKNGTLVHDSMECASCKKEYKVGWQCSTCKYRPWYGMQE
eukprot:CAMPEP_0170864436 /NCGR_PEP_ID=MMETSP0734-20130129/20483_1 /TAXON_ID=186038 /ORGANISM="Fragilariopsis kerguelensis, Strain L26-C5" /LENGTH=205 /DNA_ID=CAMNT_0011240057 /DNA_START=9 /DNA_END=626 /DNA_ORIENTATION=+